MKAKDAFDLANKSITLRKEEDKQLVMESIANTAGTGKFEFYTVKPISIELYEHLIVEGYKVMSYSYHDDIRGILKDYQPDSYCHISWK